MRHNCATHVVIELLACGGVRGAPGGVAELRKQHFGLWNRPAPFAARATSHDGETELMPMVVRAVHVLVVSVVVIDVGVVQLVMSMRRLVRVLMHVTVLMVMRMAVGMLVHHVAMTVRMAVGVRMRVGVAMLVRMAVRLVVAMAMLVFAVRHSSSP